MFLPLELWRQGEQLHRPLLLAGKLVGWSIVGPVHPGKLALISDSSSGASFLVDTGSSYIIPHSSHLPPTGPLLRSANGQWISYWGEQQLAVVCCGHRYTWAFLLADVQLNIIGVDFLQHFQLLVDVEANGYNQPNVCNRCRHCPSGQINSSTAALTTFTSHCGGTLFIFSSHSGGTGATHSPKAASYTDADKTTPANR